MFELQLWQWLVVGVTAAVCLIAMGRAIVGMFSRPCAGPPAVARRATALESALVGAEQPDGMKAFDAFSYRVSARFAGKARAVVGPATVAVSGPRVPRGLYRWWVWVQGLLLALVPALLVWAIVTLDWRPLAGGLGVLVVSFGVSAGGAGLWPGLGEMELLTHGAYQALEFPRSAVSDVAVGAGWARGGMDIVLLPYKRGVDAMAGDQAVSFFAPDEHGREVRYALHCLDAEDAEELASLLRKGAGQS